MSDSNSAAERCIACNLNPEFVKAAGEPVPVMTELELRRNVHTLETQLYKILDDRSGQSLRLDGIHADPSVPQTVIQQCVDGLKLLEQRYADVEQRVHAANVKLTERLTAKRIAFRIENGQVPGKTPSKRKVEVSQIDAKPRNVEKVEKAKKVKIKSDKNAADGQKLHRIDANAAAWKLFQVRVPRTGRSSPINKETK
jgi:hypothetical protein